MYGVIIFNVLKKLPVAGESEPEKYCFFSTNFYKHKDRCRLQIVSLRKIWFLKFISLSLSLSLSRERDRHEQTDPDQISLHFLPLIQQIYIHSQVVEWTC